MSTIRKSITFTEQLNEWVQMKVASGDYTNESEYVRDLVRRDKELNADNISLKAEIQKGLDSGTSDLTLDDIWKKAEDGLTND